MGLDLTLVTSCVGPLPLFPPRVSPLCSHREWRTENQSLSALPFSLSGFFPTFLYVLLLPVSSALFDTLDEVQLFIGLAFLNPRHGTATTTFPFPFSPISALFFFHLSFCLQMRQLHIVWAQGQTAAWTGCMFDAHVSPLWNPPFHFCFYQHIAGYIIHVCLLFLIAQTSLSLLLFCFLLLLRRRGHCQMFA